MPWHYKDLRDRADKKRWLDLITPRYTLPMTYSCRTKTSELKRRHAMTLHQHIQKHWKIAAALVVAGILAYSISYFW
jgi:hypothetical protein